MTDGSQRELLSICIPTYNRVGYLRDLLRSILDQIQKHGLTPRDLGICISDNASPDETRRVCAEMLGSYGGTVYHRNDTNIGGNANIIQVRTLTRGRYTWVMGDDELLCDRALPNILGALAKHEPGLLLAYGASYRLNMTVPALFPTYKEFAAACMRQNAHALAEHTLISSNIYLTECFDFDCAWATIRGDAAQSYSYPHMFGVLKPLIQRKLPVFLPDFPTIDLRTTRAAKAGRWDDLDAVWIEYFTWLRNELDYPGLDPAAPSRLARRLIWRNLLTNPFGYIWSYRVQLLNPSAYKFLFRRLTRRY